MAGRVVVVAASARGDAVLSCGEQHHQRRSAVGEDRRGGSGPGEQRVRDVLLMQCAGRAGVQCRLQADDVAPVFLARVGGLSVV
jgi:hypothetical protein